MSVRTAEASSRSPRGSTSFCIFSPNSSALDVCYRTFDKRNSRRNEEERAIFSLPNTNHFAIVMQLLSERRHVETGGMRIRFERIVQFLQRLRRKRSSTFAFLRVQIREKFVEVRRAFSQSTNEKVFFGVRRTTDRSPYLSSASRIHFSSTGLIFEALFGVMSSFSKRQIAD